MIGKVVVHVALIGHDELLQWRSVGIELLGFGLFKTMLASSRSFGR